MFFTKWRYLRNIATKQIFYTDIEEYDTFCEKYDVPLYIKRTITFKCRTKKEERQLLLSWQFRFQTSLKRVFSLGLITPNRKFLREVVVNGQVLTKNP